MCQATPLLRGGRGCVKRAARNAKSISPLERGKGVCEKERGKGVCEESKQKLCKESKQNLCKEKAI